MSDVIVRFQGVSRIFEHGAVRALDDVDLVIGAGETVAIVGPSGSGKTTLLNLIGALDTPSAGVVEVAGSKIHPRADLDRLRARQIGFVFQLHNLIPTLTAVENVEIPNMSLPGSRRERRRRALSLLERVGLGSRADFAIPKLSGGERQRVAVARALINGPRLLLGDEPTGSLDSRTGSEIVELLLGLQRDSGLTVVVVTHDAAVADRMQRTLSLHDGRIVGDERRGPGNFSPAGSSAPPAEAR